MEKQYLQDLIDKNLSTRQIANIINKSQASVKHWLLKYDLKTNHKSFFLKERFGIEQICKKHGLTEFSTLNKPRCKKCLVEAVTKRRIDIKQKAVKYKGGKCEKCGYNKCIAALDFHHLSPKEKHFSIGSKGYTKSWEEVKIELDKCILVCSNCHREIHSN